METTRLAVFGLAAMAAAALSACSGGESSNRAPAASLEQPASNSTSSGNSATPGNSSTSGGAAPGSSSPAGSGGSTSTPAQPTGAALQTTPPSDATTAWAPSSSDPDWVNVQSYGAVGDAVTDDTSAFRSAAATGKKLFVPKPPVAYKITSYIQIRNSVYGDGSLPEIRMYGADGDPDQGPTHNIFYIDQYRGSGLVINGLHLNGQWDGVGTNGEYSHGVQIRESNNVTVQNNFIERPYGDCICILTYSSTMPDSIVVRNNRLVGPRRCNVAVVGGTNITIAGNYIEKSNNYVSAVDLEADPLGYQYIRGVTVDGNVVNAATMQGGGGAFSALNPVGNPVSSDVTFTNNTGQWTPCTSSIALPGSNGLVSMLTNPPLSYGQPWSNVTASNDVAGSTGWSFPTATP